MAIIDPTTNPTQTTSANDIYFAAWISDNILDEERPYDVIKPHFRYEGRHASNVMQFPIMHSPGAATSNYTEGTGLANTQLTTDQAQATALANGQVASISDELEEQAVIAVLPYFSSVLGRSVAQEFETTATALLDDGSLNSGTAGVATSYATLLDAVNKLEQRDQVGTPVGVIDPAQVGSVRIDLGTSGAAALANDTMSVGDMLSPTLQGFVFNLAGANWYQTSVVTSTAGAVFIDNVALGLYEMRAPRVETIRVPAMPATMVVYTSRYGVVTIRANAVQGILGPI